MNSLKEKWSVITTDAVLVETGNGLSERKWRHAAYKWITQIQKSKVISGKKYTVKVSKASSFCPVTVNLNWYIYFDKSPKTIFRVIPVKTEILNRAVDLYGRRPDKEWGLTDCISIVVMQEYKETKVLTVDHHFEQAVFSIFINL